MENNHHIKKIAVVGPESTGKSTISARLAAHYQTIWVPEFARGYCEKLTAPCTWQDEINMFQGQLALEQQLLPKANNILICDTTILTVKIWCDYMFGHSPLQVLDEIYRRKYDFYLLMDINLPWEDDPLRDFPYMSQYFMDIWIKELRALQTTYVLISATRNQRFENAVKAIDNFLVK